MFSSISSASISTDLLPFVFLYPSVLIYPVPDSALVGGLQCMYAHAL